MEPTEMIKLLNNIPEEETITKGNNLVPIVIITLTAFTAGYLFYQNYKLRKEKESYK
jgi:hypothetical protein